MAESDAENMRNVWNKILDGCGAEHVEQLDAVIKKEGKKMTKTLIDRYNTVAGSAVMILTMIFGTYWYIFAGYLICNILDWLTGWYKSRKLGKENSKTGLRGIAKKVGYWIIILVAFLIPAMFIHIGKDLLGVDLGFLVLLGWFTLASLLVNEIRSILENLVECGYRVPDLLIRGLSVTEKLIHAGVKIPGEKEKEED